MMSLDKISGKIWLNGQFIDWQAAQIHILSHSLHYGSSVFEGERAYDGKIFKLYEHTMRLFNSAKVYGLNIPFTSEQIMEASQECLHQNNLKFAYVRPLVWYGSENLWLATGNHSINIMIAAWCPESYLQPTVKKSLNVTISQWVKPNNTMIPAHCKSAANYPTLILSKNTALQAGFDDAIMLDEHGYITECTSSNIFFVKDNIIYTPTVDCFLDGITRQTIISIATDLGYHIVEQHLTLTDVTDMDECFVTGTACEVQTISSITLINKTKIMFEKTDITDILLKHYQKIVLS